MTTFFSTSRWLSAPPAERLRDGLLHEGLRLALAKGLERRVAEAAAKALHSCHAQDLLEDEVVPVQHVDADLGQLAANLLHLVVLIVVVAEHRGAGNAERGQLLRQHLALFNHSAVGEVAAQHEQVRRGVHLLDQLPEATVVVLPAVQVTDRRQPNFRARIARHSRPLAVVRSRPRTSRH